MSASQELDGSRISIKHGDQVKPLRFTPAARSSHSTVCLHQANRDCYSAKASRL
jgi:hypothetical protein